MNNMPQRGIITGLALIALGLIGYLAGGMASWTALIPSISGVLILVPSFIAKKDRHLKLGMHLAALFGLLGFIAPFGRIIPTAVKGKFELSIATTSMILMAVICGFFLFLCIQSFMAARRAQR